MVLDPWLVAAVLAGAVLVGLVAVAVGVWLRGAGAANVRALEAHLAALERLHERTERTLRDEMARSRETADTRDRQVREELTAIMKGAADVLGAGLARTSEASERRHEALRTAVELQLRLASEDGTRRLDEIRQVVDQRLQGALESTLGESFRLVSQRLEQVHRGLGEMQALAAGVGDLKKVLANVKMRGTWGEVQLQALLEEGLAPDQYAANVVIREDAGERVEFAIRLPGPVEGQPVLLPIDAKFPVEDQQRLIEAIERGDQDAVSIAGRQLEVRLKQSARAIRDKYLHPPRTTDFGILFVPTEGLFAEILRRPGLVEYLQRECRVLLTGPTTLWAVLTSLRMGFRTLAIQRRSAEVWELLGTVKREFDRFGQSLDAVQRKLGEASRRIEQARRNTQTLQRKLDDVQLLPETDDERQQPSLLGAGREESGESGD